MNFISLTFIIFVAVLMAVYYLVPKKAQWAVILCANMAFYLWGGPKTAVYLLVTTVTSYVSGIILGRLNETKKGISKEDARALSSVKTKKRLVVLADLLINFGMLFVLKYLDYTLELVNKVFRLEGERALLTPGLLLPLGISFFIFQSAGYVIDCYRGKYEPQKNILKFSLFTSFFPQMIQGPISRYDKLGPQLLASHQFDAENMRYGIMRVMWGYFKKMVIADRCAVAVSAFFADHGSYGGAVTVFVMILYCINLYCDFSGGIDISLGIAKMMGIDVEENFKRPIFAASLAEYWRRWHITLGGWMRDYVFYPLSLSKPFAALGRWSRKHLKGKAGKILATSAATFIVYILIGIWHGSSLKYLFFGLWNGLIITSSLLLENTYSKMKNAVGIKEKSVPWRIFTVARTAFIVFIGRYITRAPRLLVGFELIGKSFNFADYGAEQLFNGTLSYLGLGVYDYIVILASVIILIAVEFYEEKKENFTAMLCRKNGFVQWAAMAAMIIIILLLGIMRGSYISSEFIYKQF